MNFALKKIVSKFFLLLFFTSFSFFSFISVHANTSTKQGNNFSDVLIQTTESIKDKVDTPPSDFLAKGVSNFVVNKVINVLFPIVVIVGVFVAMIGLYQILVSTDDKKFQEGINMIIYGVIGIIIMYSAKYLSLVIFGDIFKGGVGEAMSPVDWINFLYTKIGFPFIKIAIYLSLGILVILMIVRVFGYITAQDEASKKKSLGVIAWTTIGMLFIIGAKQIVEAVYGKQQTVLSKEVQNLSGIGTQILNPKDIPIVFSVINRSLGLVSFVLLIIILFQTYKILTKPDDAATFTSLKKTIIYALIGIILIGSAYLLSNLFIIN